MTLRIFLLSLFTLVWASCANKQDSDVKAAVYYWKSNWSFDARDQRYADSLHLSTVYVRLMDVDWDEGYQDAVPVGELEDFPGWNQNLPSQPLVPVVYITQRTWEELDANQVNLLAQRLARRFIAFKKDWDRTTVEVKANALARNAQGALQYELIDSVEETLKKQFDYNRPMEVQIDCDWTPGNKEVYFHFLKTLRQQLPANFTLSCTIRLHQFRDREKNGIPPVQRGMLMVYNVANPKQMGTNNAIFDAAKIKGYLKGDAYPVPLDWALPLFSWSVWFQQDQFMALINELEAEDIQENPGIFKHQKGNQYTLLKDTVIGPHYLREGDLIRVEAPDTESLEQVAAHIRKQYRPEKCNIAFFDWHHLMEHSEYEKDIQRCMAHIR